MKKILMLMIALVVLLSACTGKTSVSKAKNGETSCEKGGLILDNDEDPDWEIDLDGDCEGDIEFEGNESKTTKKPVSKKPVNNEPVIKKSVETKKPTQTLNKTDSTKVVPQKKKVAKSNSLKPTKSINKTKNPYKKTYKKTTKTKK